MKISNILKNRVSFSFEFFPPKTPESAKHLFDNLALLSKLQPDFVSVTHSPASVGSLQTAALSKIIKEKFGLNPMAHLTCIAHSKREIAGIVSELTKSGIENILALRGDYPPGFTAGSGQNQDYRYASELVTDLKKLSSASIGVAGYPQKHPQAASMKEDIQHLKMKVDAGAEFIITQLFFVNHSYFTFVKMCRDEGINIPVIPGIMPVTSYSQLQKFSEMCCAEIPAAMQSDIEKIKDDPSAVTAYGVKFALEQCGELLANGAPGLHFYTLNKSHSTVEIMQKLKTERTLRQNSVKTAP
ncbi:MAG: methylenetetrahydrofolate reductase [NAD(P)H] [Elusimicrobiaceae bacterium]